MSYPTAIEVDGKTYEINTGYEHALACYACIDDPDIDSTERALGVLGILYKEQPRNTKQALAMALKYLQLGREQRPRDEEDAIRDLDFAKDMHYIRSSFRSDYGIDLNERPGMHWWEFYELLQGLTDACVLNRIRDLRNYDISQVKDPRQRLKIKRAKDDVALTPEMDEEDAQKLDEFYSQLK
jgi:hypothetical protein